jgi:hypothetical protein
MLVRTQIHPRWPMPPGNVPQRTGYWPARKRPRSLLAILGCRFTDAMFVADKMLVDASFGAASAGLMRLAEGNGLASASAAAYGEGMAGLHWPGAPESKPDGPRLAGVRWHSLPESGEHVGLAVRWEAIGPDGDLFPALDADIKLTWAGDDTTELTVAGTYRPPVTFVAAGLDRAVVDPVATATIRIFLCRVAEAISLLTLAGRDGEERR